MEYARNSVENAKDMLMCVHEQVAKEDCECPLYKREICIVGCVIPYRTISSVIEEHILIWKKQTKASRNDLFAFYCL